MAEFRRARRLLPVSLWGRLVLSVLVLTTVAMAMFGVAGSVLLRQSLTAEVDERLARMMAPSVSREESPPDMGHAEPPALPSDLRELRLASDGTLLWRVGQTEEDPSGPDVSGLTAEELREADGSVFELPDTEGGADWRVRVGAAPDGTVAMLAQSLAGVDTTLALLRWVQLGAGTAVLVALASGTVAIVRVQLRPLTRMQRAADAIAGGDFEARVPEDRRHGSASETARLGAALNTMLGRLSEALREREATAERMRRFVADASHELRTPLASIRGFAELFRLGRERGRVSADPVVDDWMRRVESEAERMGTLVDGLLLLARHDEQPEVAAEDVDLAELVREGVAAARAREGGTGERVASETVPGVRVVGDRSRLRQVLDNLIGNAQVHTPPGTPVRVWVEVLEDPDRWTPSEEAVRVGALPSRVGRVVAVCVRDEGPGIRAQDRARLFDRFFRADEGRSRHTGGAGLGLAISAAVVSAHGGVLEVVSGPGQGTLFRVLLPLG
ncbi:HAMP domain-containing histidine kinase [Nocardiopsis sp. EMB25]|uniref:sensor histidine kinase n=1 Tax=Nocardiopsis sp. EMB25 TaxID=2835867 RepID=UPI002283DE01|nr:HAMP domain-containing sensor histidine kinase [Nocardiopsis sp. EMB25]MCY9784734.1 HAMP domain-containing histidine kinase [Nocardiopsis sp. EMB25]